MEKHEQRRQSKLSMSKQRAVVCVGNPQDFIPQLSDYSLMIVNPNSSESRLKYLLDNSDWSLLITKDGEQYRNGSSYSNEDVLWYTSGTTGDSKFCSFTHEHLDIMAKKICKTYDITANDRYVSIMPLWHAHGQGLYWATKLAQCETNYVTVKTIRDFAKHQPSFISAIPEILKTISYSDFDGLRFIRSCSSPMSHSLYQHLREKYQVPVVEAFGMTETLSHCFTNPLHGEQRIGTVGLPDGIEANIIDGRLYVAGPTVISTGWFDTGDLAEQDDHGYYKILGRHRDQINVKGIKFNPTSLESQLKANVTGLTDCVIFGTDSVKCLYVGDCDADDINKFLISLDRHCRPVLLRQVDSIPISPSGKISRSWLQQFIS
jgi:long-subunit acyl-CoA synthetase (AMP-forming)